MAELLSTSLVAQSEGLEECYRFVPLVRLNFDMYELCSLQHGLISVNGMADKEHPNIKTKAAIRDRDHGYHVMRL